MTIKVGDYVTHQRPSYRNKEGQGFQPMGLAGCKVVAINGNEASLEWVPRFVEGVERFSSPLEYLTKEED